MNKSIANWIDRILDGEIPDNVIAFCFNLYEESEGEWSMEIVGTEDFDPEDEDWACEEVTDFGSRDDLYRWKMDCDWEEAFEYMIEELSQYLESGKHAKLLKSTDGVGVGFVDGDLEILYMK